ncbi:LuxR C-terminal-related transcriptional regulator [Motilibacter aurantiacus]|uniref:LuxR C-terminal-related transcriptional regulator n=1 Tax=Motilibacter aurantiacus TaxID=2714955 RepID=UPI00140BFC64|nr:LuxR C-terminal-related transcriptional regulator [Motilibacter aurantiacus]NHC46758.1 hypothetical protein [Motilibacter aurantiacus]
MPHRKRHGDDPVERAARAALCDALLAGDEPQAEAAAMLLLRRGCPLASLYSEVVQPLLEEIGEGWARGEVSVAEEHRASTTVRGLVIRLRAHTTAAAPTRAGRAVLLPAPAETHLLGLSMLEHVLLDAGWRVDVLDPLPAHELGAYVRARGDVKVVGLGASTRRDSRELTRLVLQVRGELPDVPVLLGGGAVRADPGLPARVGADGGARTLTDAVQVVEKLTNPLTPRELDVLAGVSAGCSNNEIAADMGIAPSTVKSHLERVYTKTGSRDRAAAVATAMRRGWLR